MIEPSKIKSKISEAFARFSKELNVAVDNIQTSICLKKEGEQVLLSYTLLNLYKPVRAISIKKDILNITIDVFGVAGLVDKFMVTAICDNSEKRSIDPYKVNVILIETQKEVKALLYNGSEFVDVLNTDEMFAMEKAM